MRSSNIGKFNFTKRNFLFTTMFISLTPDTDFG